jgi:hypothetical protein
MDTSPCLRMRGWERGWERGRVGRGVRRGVLDHTGRDRIGFVWFRAGNGLESKQGCGVK